MKVVCLSDTHLRHAGLDVPDGDLLVVAGDVTRRGAPEELAEVDRWLAGLPHRHKVLVAGNHDFGLQHDPGAGARLTGATYLEDSGTTVDGLTVWGSPWQPLFFDWAFNLPRGAPLRERWDLIPAGTTILVTHGPPRGILDRVDDGQHVGCDDLLTAVRRVRPRLHVFGHIHESAGTTEVDGTVFVNASVCDRRYRPVNPPIVVEL